MTGAEALSNYTRLINLPKQILLEIIVIFLVLCCREKKSNSYYFLSSDHHISLVMSLQFPPYFSRYIIPEQNLPITIWLHASEQRVLVLLGSCSRLVILRIRLVTSFYLRPLLALTSRHVRVSKRWPRHCLTIHPSTGRLRKAWQWLMIRQLVRGDSFWYVLFSNEWS